MPNLDTAFGEEFFRALDAYGGRAPYLMERFRGVIREDEAWHYCSGLLEGARMAGVTPDESCSHFWLFGSSLGECETPEDYAI